MTRKTATTELDRIRAAYARYDADSDVRRRWSPAQPGNAANRARLKQRLAAMLPDVAAMRILEIGCGSGEILALLTEIGAREENLSAVDIRESAVEEARRRLRNATIAVADGGALPFSDTAFDAVALFGVLSSVLSPQSRQSIAAEAMRVLRPGGAIVWYDARLPNRWNPNVRPLSRASLKHLFPAFELRLVSATLIPQIARRLGVLTDALFPPLHAVPILRSHWLGLIEKPAGRS